jgi:amino acid transporter
VPWEPFSVPGQSLLTSVGYALAVGRWTYSGYDSISVLAGEIEEPRRVIPRGRLIAMPLRVISYIVPTLAALAGVGRWSEWTTEGFTSVEIAKALGGSALGSAMLVAAVVSDLALYQEYLAQGARPAYAMAAERLRPAGGARYSALNSVGLFSHDHVENRHSSLGGRSTLSAVPCLVASTTEAGASSR